MKGHPGRRIVQSCLFSSRLVPIRIERIIFQIAALPIPTQNVSFIAMCIFQTCFRKRCGGCDIRAQWRNPSPGFARVSTDTAPFFQPESLSSKIVHRVPCHYLLRCFLSARWYLKRNRDKIRLAISELKFGTPITHVSQASKMRIKAVSGLRTRVERNNPNRKNDARYIRDTPIIATIRSQASASSEIDGSKVTTKCINTNPGRTDSKKLAQSTKPFSQQYFAPTDRISKQQPQRSSRSFSADSVKCEKQR